MESLFIVLILISIVVLIVGLTKPEVIKLKSRKDVTLAGGGLIVFFFICAAIASPATQTPSTPVVTTTENSTPVATTSAPVTQAPVVTKKTVVTQPVVIAPVQATVPVVTPVVTPTPAQPVTLLDISGQGSKSTQNFTTPSDAWQVNYTYDCSNFGDKGNFQVYICFLYTSDAAD